MSDINPHHPPKKEWVIDSMVAKKEVLELSKQLQIHPLVTRMLYTQGLQDVEEIQKFIQPSLRHMIDPFIMKGMRESVLLILKSVEKGEKIIIHGDYDVDGISSVSLLYSYLRDFGANVDFFVPRRDQDGYGISSNSIERFSESGYQLLISTDCGVSNVEEIALARRLGMKVIVVDHHQVPPELPKAHAIINPLQSDCPYPFKHLAAVGVVFSLATAIRAELRRRGIFKSIPEPDLRDYLDLVALGTVADVMPLHDQNRILVHHGLKILAARRRPGIAALMEKVNIPEGPITTNDISFKLAPRLNAAGRIADAALCVELLTTNSFAEAVRLTRELEDLNIQRKEEERITLDSALQMAHEQGAKEHQVLVLAGRTWHHGVLGIVASRLVDMFHKPAVLLRLDEEKIAKGSARAIPGIDLVDLFKHADEHLLSYGGHKLAAGLSLNEASIEKFRTVLNEKLIEHQREKSHSAPILRVCGEVSLSDLTLEFVHDLSKLAPFGSGNPEPSFLSRPVTATSSSVVGRNHLRLRIVDNGRLIPAFGFSLAHAAELVESAPFMIAYSPRLVQRRGSYRIELFIRGIRELDANVTYPPQADHVRRD